MSQEFIARGRKIRPGKDTRTPPRIFREMRLGEHGRKGDRVPVVAGIEHRWWVPDFLGPNVPVIVWASILREHTR